MRWTPENGRPRLMTLLSILVGGACATAMALVVVLYGTPFNPLWWLVMMAILAASFILPCFGVWAIEWVIEGYLGEN